MKHHIRLALVLLCSVSVAAAQEPSNSNPSVTPRVVEALVVGLSSENAGVQRSCALMLGQLRCSSSRIALMKVLRNGANAGCRSAAAWALCRIGDPSGVMLVRATAERDEDPRMRAICAWYYNQTILGLVRSDIGADVRDVAQNA
jgi:HEAT repeat protein